MKKCIKCNIEKEDNDFVKKKNSKICKQCFNKRSKELRTIKNNGLTDKEVKNLKTNLTDQEFDNLVVIKRVGNTCKWECKCKCGNPSLVYFTTTELTNKRRRSCGCYGKYGENIHQKSGSYNWKGCGDLSGSFFNGYKNGARHRNLEFNIDIKYTWNKFIKQDRKCALTGIELQFSTTNQNTINTTASLDRIDSSKGYIEGNIQWIHKDLQRMKWNFDQEYFIKICKLIANYHGNKESYLQELMSSPETMIYQNLGITTKVVTEDKLPGMNYAQRKQFFNQLNLIDDC